MTSARRKQRRRSRKPHVLILLENLPLERDQRVRRECRALLDDGYAVSVICPRGSGNLPNSLAEVALHDYPAPLEARSALGYIWEFAYSWVMTAALTLKLAVIRPFDVIQACNPPDTMFAIAAPFRLLGKPFVFDHHDLTPELFTAQYSTTSGPVFRALQALERATYACASHVLASNDSFRRVALSRGGKSESEVTVVRNGPELAAGEPRSGRMELRRGRDHLCVWIGTMFVDDGLEVALQAVRHLVHEIHREDCHFAFVGDGAKREQMLELVRELEIEPWVSFPGWLPLEAAYEYLATADLGLSPNPKSPRLDVSTSMKVMEYMVVGLPVAAFDVLETRQSAGAAAAYAQDNDPAAYARMIDQLLDDADRREQMGRVGRRRIEDGLAWDHQKVQYLAVYHRLVRKVDP